MIWKTGCRRTLKKRHLAAIIVLAALALLVLALNTSRVFAETMQDAPAVGGIFRVLTFRTYEEKTDSAELYVEVPQIDYEGPNATAVDTIAALNLAFREQAEAIVAQYEEALAEMGADAHISVYSAYKVLRNDDTLLSICINTSISKADTNETIRIYNVDKQTGELLQLKDLFLPDSDYVERLSDIVIQQMLRQMQADESTVYWVGEQADEQDRFTAIAENQTFYITDTGALILFFDKYTVAPGYMGVPQFVIPTSGIRDILEQPSLIS